MPNNKLLPDNWADIVDKTSNNRERIIASESHLFDTFNKDDLNADIASLESEHIPSSDEHIENNGETAPHCFSSFGDLIKENLHQPVSDSFVELNRADIDMIDSSEKCDMKSNQDCEITMIEDTSHVLPIPTNLMDTNIVHISPEPYSPPSKAGDWEQDLGFLAKPKQLSRSGVTITSMKFKKKRKKVNKTAKASRRINRHK